MKNKNTLSETRFTVLQVVAYLAVFFWFFTSNLPGVIFGDGNSGATFASLWFAVCCVLGVAVCIRRRRNWVSIAVNALFPVETFWLVSYYPYMSRICNVVLSVTAVLCLIYLGLILLRRLPQQNRSQVILHRVYCGLMGARTILVVCLLVVTVALLRSAGGKRPMMEPETEPVSSQEGQEWTVKNKLDTARLLKEEEWKKLTVEQRLEVLSVMANIEARYLGLDHGLKVGAHEIGSTLGCYRETEQQILIDLQHLKNSAVEDVLHTLCHEAYHAYEWMQVRLYREVPEKYRNMYLFWEAKLYEEEFENYIDAVDDYEGYASQWVERMANQYADISVEDIYERIEECIAEENAA